MNEAEYLHARAQKCLRMARAMSLPNVARELEAQAAEFERQAAQFEAHVTQRK